jgi:hypothetical protein
MIHDDKQFPYGYRLVAIFEYLVGKTRLANTPEWEVITQHLYNADTLAQQPPDNLDQPHLHQSHALVQYRITPSNTTSNLHTLALMDRQEPTSDEEGFFEPPQQPQHPPAPQQLNTTTAKSRPRPRTTISTFRIRTRRPYEPERATSSRQQIPTPQPASSSPSSSSTQPPIGSGDPFRRY